MYRIHWRARTGATGQGDPIFRTRAEAETVASDLNRCGADIQLHHWVEDAIGDAARKQKDAEVAEAERRLKVGRGS